MVYIKLVVPLGYLAAISLARPAPTLSEAELTARQSIDLAESSPGTAPLAFVPVDIPDRRSPTYSATNYGSVREFGTTGGAPSPQDTSDISSCVLSPTRGGANASGSCSEVADRGLSDHLNPTFPDEDEGEE